MIIDYFIHGDLFLLSGVFFLTMFEFVSNQSNVWKQAFVNRNYRKFNIQSKALEMGCMQQLRVKEIGPQSVPTSTRPRIISKDSDLELTNRISKSNPEIPSEVLKINEKIADSRAVENDQVPSLNYLETPKDYRRIRRMISRDSIDL